MDFEFWIWILDFEFWILNLDFDFGFWILDFRFLIKKKKNTILNIHIQVHFFFAYPLQNWWMCLIYRCDERVWISKIPNLVHFFTVYPLKSWWTCLIYRCPKKEKYLTWFTFSFELLLNFDERVGFWILDFEFRFWILVLNLDFGSWILGFWLKKK